MNFDAPMTQAGLGGLGPLELGLILVIVLIVFGAGRLPQIGSALGQAIRNFKKGTKEEEPKKDKGSGRAAP